MVVRQSRRQHQQRAAVGGVHLDTSCALKHPVSEEVFSASLSTQRSRASAFDLFCAVAFIVELDD